MAQADSAPTTTPLPFPTRPMPLAQPFGSGWMPVIRHPNRPEYITFARYPRKAKATAAEALAYAERALAWQQHFAGFKRRRREATVHPRYLPVLQAAE